MHLKPRTAGWAAVTVLALFLVGLTGFWAFDFGQRRQLEVSRATERVTAAGYALTQQMTSVLSDLIYLSQLGSFQRWRGTGGADRPALELDWQAYLQDHPYIQQVRLLNVNGDERVRVHRMGGEIFSVPSSRLQSKSDRYYYVDALALEPGQIYLSALDLNVEQGVVEKPYRPMMRFVMRLANGQGETDGMLVLNVDANYLLRPLRQSAPTGTASLQLADADGRLIVDSSGVAYWDQGHDVPVAQLSAGLLEGDEKLTVAVNGARVETRLLLSLENETGPSAIALAQGMPWYLISRQRVSWIPLEHSLMAVFWSGLLLLSLGALCALLARRSIQLEYSLSEANRYRRQAQHSAEQSAALVAQLGEGILLFDEEQRLMQFNERSRQLLEAGGRNPALQLEAHTLLPELCRFGHLQAGPGEIVIESSPPKLMQAVVSHLMLGSDPRHLVVVSDYGQVRTDDSQLIYLSQTLDASDEMLLLYRSDMTVEYANQSARQTLGLSSEGDRLGSLVDYGFRLDESPAVVMARLAHDGAFAEGQGELAAQGRVRTVSYELRRISHFRGELHFLLRARDITNQTSAASRFDELDQIDQLTVMASRVQIAREFEAQCEGRERLAMLIFDIDRLRMINNSLGYRAGDSVIRQVSRRVSEVLDKGYAARLTADSFVVLYDGDEAGVFELIERTQRRVGEPMTLGQQRVKVSISAGLAFWPEHAVQFEPLLQAAQIALNTGKGLRGQISVFKPGSVQSSRDQLDLEEYLKRAIEEERFELHFQPVVNARDGRVEHFEALLRLRDENGQPLSPGRFVPILEDSGWIMLLEPWLLRTAISAAALLARRIPGGSAVAINICGQELLDPGFIERLLDYLEEYACEPGWISLEVTERQFLEHPEAIISVLTALRELGVRVAVDDFGTGYSSLAYVKRLPVEHLKIDREFIKELPDSPADEAIVRSVGRMAEGLDMKVIAEGVETVDQMRWLARHHVVLYQGFLFARAAPLETWLSVTAIEQVLQPLEQSLTLVKTEEA
ncbi:MAG: hypothetical protein CMI01_12525 [Oceanospirillaceae bacterium]|nr:hypothetical protein [Oceanospirillaceae bacterium]